MDLLIRPVQRLPSVQLLLKGKLLALDFQFTNCNTFSTDILKATDKCIPDHRQLELAYDKIVGVLNHINEDKRKTEGQVAMFDVVNDIKDCPAFILSAQRKLIGKVDAKLLLNENESLVPHKDFVTLFLFNDLIQVS